MISGERVTTQGSGGKVRVVHKRGGDPGKTPPAKKRSIRLREKLPPRPAKARNTAEPLKRSGPTQGVESPKLKTPGRVHGVGRSKTTERNGKEPPPELLAVTGPADLKIPIGILFLNVSATIAERRGDPRCVALPKEVDDFERLFNAWVDYRLPFLVQFAPDFAMLIPVVAYIRRISTLPPRSRPAAESKNESEQK